MGSAALKPSVAVGNLLRKKRQELRLTLREVSEQLTERGDRIPTSTLARIEQGKVDPGVRRLHLLLALYRVPPHLVADLVELETLAVERPAEGDLEALHREGIKHWKSGNVAEGLSYLFAVREFVPDDEPARILRQQATLSFAVAARNLGKYRLARQIIDDLLCEPPDRSLIVRSLVLASSLWRGLGSIDVGLALVRQASSHLRKGGDPNEVWVLHQEARLLLEIGQLDEAERLTKRALALYRRSGDTYGEVRALVLRVGLLEKRGDLKRALECARKVIRLSESNGHARGVAYGLVEQGRLLVSSGSAHAGMESLNRGLGQAVQLQDRNAEFLAHYHLWKAHEFLDDSDRSRFEFEAAAYFVRFIDDHFPEADEVREILEKRSKK